MKITLSPTRSEARLSLSRKGNVLTFNGTAVNLTKYDPEAAPCDWIIGAPAKEGGDWHVTVLFPYGADAPEAALFPAPITLMGDGPVALPPADPAPEAFEIDPQPAPPSDDQD